jgi:RNA polymerase sigma factor for flagellar operon FliA
MARPLRLTAAMQLSTSTTAETTAFVTPPSRPERRRRDLAERNRLVEQTLWVVRALAVELLRAHHFSITVEDLEAYGRCGLLEAADSFDERHGTRFTTFAYYRIRGEMLDAIRDGAGQCTQSELAYMRRSRAEAPNSARETEPDEQITIINHDLAQVIATARVNDDGDALSPQELADSSRVAGAVRAAIGKLPERERQVVEHLYFVPGASLATASREFGIDRSWLCRVHARALEQLRSELASLQP